MPVRRYPRSRQQLLRNRDHDDKYSFMSMGTGAAGHNVQALGIRLRNRSMPGENGQARLKKYRSGTHGSELSVCHTAAQRAH
jgi:hypothetical protein